MGDSPSAELLDRIFLAIWSLCTLVGTVSLLVYLPMSTSTSLENLSETPTLLTIVFGFCALTSFELFILLRKRPAVTSHLQRVLATGSAAAILGFASYAGYVYAFSETLPDSNAPNVGETPPDFEVTDPDGRHWKLSNFRGSTVLLVFYRGDW